MSKFTIRLYPFRLWLCGGYSHCLGYGGRYPNGSLIPIGISRHIYFGYCRDIDPRKREPFCTDYYIHGEEC